jgi:putative transposase
LCQECETFGRSGQQAALRVYARFMPRRPRIFAAGIYHFGSHASDARHLFQTEQDRLLFLERLELVLQRFELGLVSYTLMGNHYHLVLRIPDGRVSKALQELHTWYSRRHNQLYGRRAHLFRAHPFAREVESEEDLLITCRYLAWNPVEAGLCRDPLAWPWSSVPATAGLQPARLPLDLEPLRGAFGDGAKWRVRYQAFVADGIDGGTEERPAEAGPEVAGAGFEPATSGL